MNLMDLWSSGWHMPTPDCPTGSIPVAIQRGPCSSDGTALQGTPFPAYRNATSLTVAHGHLKKAHRLAITYTKTTLINLASLPSSIRNSPAWFRLLNTAWKATWPVGGRIRLDKDELIRRARKTTGLTNLGADFNDEPLDRLLRSIEGEAGLHAAGRFITRERLVGLLAIRLRAEHYFRKYPAILDQPLYPVWIIIGLQRTGTTKLQRLLAMDPDHRVIPSWEVINPVPLSPALYDLSSPLRAGAQSYPHPRDRRIAIARTSVNAVRFISPGFFAVHPIDVMQPEEDILLLDVSFMSTTPEATMHVPSYAAWLEQTDQGEAYAYAAKLLRLLQWVSPARRWVLKSPHHLEFPDLISRHFGDVRFIWPHREPAESVPSFLSMVTYNRLIFSDKVEVAQVSGHWVRKVGYMLGRALEYRRQGQNDLKFTDIHYRKLVADSIAELEKVYRMNGGLTEELTTLFKQHEAENPHRKHGTHVYSLEDFGLTAADIERNTGEYRQFFREHYGRTENP